MLSFKFLYIDLFFYYYYCTLICFNFICQLQTNFTIDFLFSFVYLLVLTLEFFRYTVNESFSVLCRCLN